MKISMVLIILTLISVGCASDSPYGPKAAIYSGQELRVTYGNTLHRTFEGTREALRDMGMNITSFQKSADSGFIQAVTSQGTDVIVTMQSPRPDLTEVDIRVGTYGDEHLSEEIGRQIDKRV